MRGMHSPIRSEPKQHNGWIMFVDFRVFRGAFISWQSLFTQAAQFATEVGPERLISISHSEDKDDGVVTVWFWNGSAAPVARPANGI